MNSNKNITPGKSFSSGSSVPKTLLDNEVASLKQGAHSRSIRDYTMISLAIGTGLRNHELVSLTVFCVAPFGTVCNELDLPNLIAKGGRGRIIPFHPDLQTDLENFYDWKLKNFESIDPNAPLFCSKFSKKMLSERDFQRIVKTLGRTVLKKEIHPHIFRHTFATKLIRKSSLAIVQKLLGHANIQNTQIYCHPSRNDLVEAISNM